MELIAIAVPFFLLALLIEVAVDRRLRAGRYRSNDAVNSISAGMLDTTLGYFTRFLPLLAWGFALQHLAVWHLPLESFDLSLRGVALWVLAAVAWDFCYYWFHRFSHEIPVLWAAHVVHHQSEDYNLSTALRQTSTGFLFGWIFYLPLFVLGFPLEVILVVNGINLIYQFWVHTQFIRRLGPLEAVLMTPSHHRVHHAQNTRYLDRNYGGMFIVWDRWFGTFEPEREDEPVVFGVRQPLHSWNPFWANLQVYALLARESRAATNWRDRLGAWLRPARRPVPVEGAPRELAGFEKFDPPRAAGLRRYVIGQFAVAILVVLWIGERYVSAGPASVVVPCLALWAQLYSLGRLNEGHPGGGRTEYARLLLLTPLLYASWPLVHGATSLVGWAGLAVYAVGSTLLLRLSGVHWKVD